MQEEQIPIAQDLPLGPNPSLDVQHWKHQGYSAQPLPSIVFQAGGFLKKSWADKKKIR